MGSALVSAHPLCTVTVASIQLHCVDRRNRVFVAADGWQRRARAYDRSGRRAPRGTGGAHDRTRVARGGRSALGRPARRRAADRRADVARSARARARVRAVIDATTSALEIAASVRAGKVRARDVVAGALARIDERDGALNAFTRVLSEHALADADTIDRRLAQGDDPGPLAGVPFAVKNLFDIAGVTTLAGSKINADRAPATRDATAVARLR